MAREKKQYDDEFKRHIVELYDAGQKQADLAKTYKLHPTSIRNWVNFYHNSGSFKQKDNLTDEQRQIRELEKKLHEKQLEIDVLKKAMVVMLKN